MQSGKGRQNRADLVFPEGQSVLASSYAVKDPLFFDLYSSIMFMVVDSFGC
jgi:hypothetical protein